MIQQERKHCENLVFLRNVRFTFVFVFPSRLQLYFIFSDTKEILITKNDNQLYEKLIISDQEALQTL